MRDTSHAPSRGSAAYAGPDRRRPGPPLARLRGGVSVAALVGTGLAVAATSGAFGQLAWLTNAENAAVAVLGSAGALMLAVLCALAWHILGRAGAAWLAAAFAVYGLGNLLVSYLHLPHVVGPVDVEALTVLPPASRLAAIVLIALAALGPEVVSRLRLLRALAVAAALVVVLALALWLAPGLVAVLTSTGDLANEAMPVAGAVLIGLLGTLVAVLAVQARRRTDPLLWWVALLAGLLAVAEALRSPDVAAAGQASGNVLRTSALILAALGVAGYLLSVLADQRGALLRSQEASRVANAKLVHAGEAHSELRHEARNALSAIAMATRALEQSQQLMDEGARGQLSRAIATEVERLSELLDHQPAGSAAPIGLADALAAQVTAARAGGLTIDVDIPPRLTVLADPRPLAQVLANLLANARRHAPGSPVTLWATRADNGVVLRCEDRGPGVAVQDRHRVFARGVHGTGAPPESSGLGLYVAARLMREQASTIWVDERPGGGASFAMWLPDGGDDAAGGDAPAGAGR